MAVFSDHEILSRLRKLYQEAFHIHSEPSNEQVLMWAEKPELWAEHQIRFCNKSYHYCEAMIRHCRSMIKRARRAVDAAAAADIYNELHRRAAEVEETAVAIAAATAAGADPFDPLMPACTTGNCPITTQVEAQ